MPAILRTLPRMLKEAFRDWREDNAPRLGAALSYYTVFSLAPLLLIAVAIAGAVFGEEAATGQVMGQLRALLGEEGAQAIQALLENARRPGEGVVAGLVGLATLFLGASGVFNELRGALNTIWEVPVKPGGGLWKTVRERLLSFAMVLVLGFLLLVSLLMSTALAAVGARWGGFLSGTLHLLEVANFVVFLGVATVLFALIYKFLPDVHPPIAWRDVWAGALMTSVLFSIGKWGIGLYLGRGTVGSAFGAAGSLVVVLVWVYYAAQVMFLGAELTQVYAHEHGSRAGAPEASAPADDPAAAPREAVAAEPRAARVSPGRVAKGAGLAAALIALGWWKGRD
jgi:membrane protein